MNKTQRDYRGQEREILELRGLSKEAKGFLFHHINNTLTAIIGHCELGDVRSAKQAAWQLHDIIQVIKGDKKSGGEGDGNADEVLQTGGSRRGRGGDYTTSSSSLRQAGSTMQMKTSSLFPEFVMLCTALGGI